MQVRSPREHRLTVRTYSYLVQRGIAPRASGMGADGHTRKPPLGDRAGRGHLTSRGGLNGGPGQVSFSLPSAGPLKTVNTPRSAFELHHGPSSNDEAFPALRSPASSYQTVTERCSRAEGTRKASGQCSSARAITNTSKCLLGRATQRTRRAWFREHSLMRLQVPSLARAGGMKPTHLAAADAACGPYGPLAGSSAH